MPPVVRFLATPAAPRLLTETRRLYMVTSRKSLYAVHRDLPTSKTCVLAFLRAGHAEQMLRILDAQQRARRAIDGRLDAAHTLSFPDDREQRPWRPLAVRGVFTARLEDQCMLQYWDLWVATEVRRHAVTGDYEIHVREVATVAPPSRHAAERQLERLLHGGGDV